MLYTSNNIKCWLSLCSEDSSEDPMSSGEESLSSSLGSDAEGPYFPLHIRRQKHRQHLHLAWSLPPPHFLLIYFMPPPFDAAALGGEPAQEQAAGPVETLPSWAFGWKLIVSVGACPGVTFQVFKGLIKIKGALKQPRMCSVVQVGWKKKNWMDK